MRVMIFEPDHTGHRFTYLRFLLPAVAALPVEAVAMLGQGARENPEFQAQLGAIGNVRFEPIVPSWAGSPLARARGRARAFVAAVDAVRPHHIIVPTADGLVQLLAIASRRWHRDGVECEAALHHPAFAYPSSNWQTQFRRWLSYRAIAHAPIDRVHIVDQLAVQWIAKHGTRSLGRRARWLPDPVDLPNAPLDRVAARRQLEVSVDGPYIGCVGLLDARKGVDLLLRAFTTMLDGEAGGMAGRATLLLAGRLSPDIRSMLGEPQFAKLVTARRIIVHDRYVSDDELSATLAGSDLVCVPNPTHIGISNVVLRSAAVGRPVLTSGHGWMGAVVPANEIGWTGRVDDSNSLAILLAHHLPAAVDWVPSVKAIALAQAHQPRHFGSMLTARLAERCGVASATD